MDPEADRTLFVASPLCSHVQSDSECDPCDELRSWSDCLSSGDWHKTLLAGMTGGSVPSIELAFVLRALWTAMGRFYDLMIMVSI